MTYHIWQLSVIFSFISTVAPGKAKIVQFNGPVKLFIDKDSKSNFTTKIITYFNKVSRNSYQIIYADGANICSRVDTQFVLKTLTTTQITIILNEHMNRPCELPIGRGVVLQFFKTGDSIAVDFINQGVRMPNIRFHDNEVNEIDRFLNDVCLSIEPNIRRRRQVRQINELGEDKETSGARVSMNLWVIVVIAIIICLGFIVISTLFYFDHRKNLKRLGALRRELTESTRNKTQIKLPPEKLEKNKQPIHGEGKNERELREREKAKKEGMGKNDEQNDESSKTAILNAGRVPLFVKDVFDLANFCVGYGGTEEVIKRDAKTIVSGSINKDNIEPNEISNSPVAIIDELETTILPMFQQTPKMRAHSFFPGVQSLTDILIEFGCNLLAAKGYITDGSPGMLELEMVATSWVGKALGLPSCFLRGQKTRGGGLLLTTTTESMFTAILAARQRKLREILSANAADRHKKEPNANVEDFLKNMVAYGCSEAHLSFDFGCRLAKVEDKLISPDAEDTMNVDELEHEIMEDVKNKRTPIFINTTFGSSHSCSLDRLHEITKIAKKYNIWVHVDASYAGNYLVCPSYRSLINGLENANSISVNLHKCLTQSSHTTFFWTTDLRAVKESIPLSQNMLKMLHSDGSYHELATAASNRYKPLKTYLWLRLCGLEGLRTQITTIVKMSARFRQHLNNDGRLEDKTPTQDFGFIVFRYKGGKEEQTSQKTYRFCCYIIKSNKMSVTLVSPRSINMIRMTFNREHFDEEEIDDSWNVLKRLLDDWEEEEGRGKIATKSECERLICSGTNSIFAPPLSVNISASNPPSITASPMEAIQKPNNVNICEEDQIRQQKYKNAQDIVKNSATCDIEQAAKEIPGNTTSVEISAKDVSNKEASRRKKSEEKRSAKDTDTSSSSEKEDDEESERRSTKKENQQSSSSDKDEELPNEHDKSSTSSQSSDRSNGREQPSPIKGPTNATKKVSSSSFKTLKAERLLRSKHNVPEQMVKDVRRVERRQKTVHSEGATSKRR